ncbi:MAG: PAS domain S-box protein [Bacteroidota bacterium]
MPKNTTIISNLAPDDLNALFFSITTNCPNGIAFIDADYKVRYANETIANLTGVPLKNIGGINFDLILPYWSRQIRGIFDEVRRTGEYFKTDNDPFRIENQEKQCSYWEITVSPVNHKNSIFQGWLLMLQEVTKHRKIQAENVVLIKELEAQIKLLRMIPESSPAGIAIIDGVCWTVKWVNQAYLAFINNQFQSKDLIGRLFEDYLPESKKSELMELLRKVASSHQSAYVELNLNQGRFWNCNATPVFTRAEVPDLVFATYEITEQIANRRRAIECASRAESHLHQLEAVIENMEDGVIIFDLNEKIVKMNTAALHILGYNDFQDCPANLFEIRTDLEFSDLKGNVIPEEEWPSNRIRRGETVRNFEAAVRRISSGKIRYLSYNGTLINNSNQIPALAVMTVRDISDREKLLRELEQEHSRLQAVLEQMPCGVMVFDASSLKRNLVNKKYNEIWQVANTAVESDCRERYGELFHNDGRAYSREELPLFRSIYNGEIVSNEEMICQRKDGSTVSIMCNSAPILGRDGKIVEGMLVFTDITKLKETTAKAALANQLQQIIEFLPDGIFVVDQERKITAWNRALELLTGILKQVVIGREFNANIGEGFEQLMLFDVIFNNTDSGVDVKYERIGDVFGKQVLLTLLNKRENVLLDIKATPIRDDHGAIIGVIETIRDITGQKELEAETIRMQKLESLGILAGGIAHDFNNILAAILANLQLAMVKFQKHQDISKHLEHTIETTLKASCLTRQLLTFAKGGVPIKKNIAITGLVRDTVQFALSGSNVKAIFSLPEDLWLVNADEGQLTQVINNITINAEQAMPTGGVIEIYGENVIYEATGKYNPGRYVKLTIKDHGLGIPEEIIHKIFDPFFTTKKVGSGLGLSTTYSIIKRHDGYLEVESSPGTGATFYIFLPASLEKIEAKEAPGEINAGVDAKILLLDDEDILRNVSGELLTFFGYRVVLAKNGQEAIELYQKAKQNGEPFQAVIMDLTIPGGMGGLETMAKLRQFDPEIKAIVSSGYANDPVISNYEQYGFSGVVIKPYKIDNLVTVLDQVIEKRQLPLDLSD